LGLQFQQQFRLEEQQQLRWCLEQTIERRQSQQQQNRCGTTELLSQTLGRQLRFSSQLS
jgi:hypothetical protein